MCIRDLSLLIIEDHKIIAQAYKDILSSIESIKFKIDFAENCDTAINKIHKDNFDIIILDLQLPKSENEKYLSGEDLALFIRRKNESTKIIVLTSVTNHSRILSLVEEIQPEAFMIKADIDSEDLKSAIYAILHGKKCYSKTIENLLYNSNINGVIIDDYDRQILYHLSMGEKTKNLSKFIPLSTRAIEVRKTKLKTLLDPNKDPNFNLVKEAKKLGFV